MAAVFRAGCKTASHGAFNVFQTTNMSEGNDIGRDDFSRGLGHQAKRIAGQLDEWLAVFAERHVKFFAEPSQRILGVELKREALVR